MKSRQKKTVAIIQARMGSARLPGKVLMDIAGHPLLWHVVQRTKSASCVDKVVVATSDNASDDAVEDFCRKEKVTCFRGSEKDVLSRFYDAAKTEFAETVIRITGDCPLIDPAVIDAVAKGYSQKECDYATNTLRYTYPEGLDVEIFSMKALETANKNAKRESDREHVTPYLRVGGQFVTFNVEHTQDYSKAGHFWSVDHPTDLEFVRSIYAKFKGRTDFGFQEVIECLERHPEIAKLNAGKIMNEGYFRSLYQTANAVPANKLQLKESERWFKRSREIIPGAAQTFSKSYLQYVQGASPLFLKRGRGCRVWDVDGNEYIDYIQGLLPNILGYAEPRVNAAAIAQLDEGHSFSLPHPIEVELSEKLIQLIPSAEMVRFGKNGSDATSGAIRAARAFTKRERVAVCGYHGWQDWYIGSTTRNAGVPKAVSDLTHSFTYNDLDSLEKVLSAHHKEFAAVMMEPMNFTEPDPGFLAGVKALAHKHGALLIFDEICSGFMFGLGGLQKEFGVTPDMACFGKAMGNGFPISCIVGRRDVMKTFEDIFYSFTFAGEAQSMAAALKVLDILETTDALKSIEAQGRVLKDGLNALAKEAGLGDRIQCVGRPQWSLFKFKDAQGNDGLLERSLFQQEAAKRGVLLLMTHNVSASHDSVSTEKTLEAYASVLKTLSQWLNDSKPERFLEGELVRPIFKVR